MIRFIATSVVSLGFLFLVSSDFVRAQPPYYPRYGRPPYGGSYPTPGLSPYLNLLRGGSPAANYYNGVIPERDRRAFELESRQSILDLEQRTQMPTEGEDLLPTLPETGHATRFGYYGQYFNTGTGVRNLPARQAYPPRRTR